MQETFHIFPLSENALTIDFGNRIDVHLNDQVLALAKAIEVDPFPGLIEVVPAYSSLTVFYDLRVVRRSFRHFSSAFESVKSLVETQLDNLASFEKAIPARVVKVPVCYSDSFGLDWAEVCKHTGLSRAEIIKRHTDPIYRVFMLGFLPGFTYLGGMNKEIAVPRKAQPRTRVEAGSVGIAGQQTGIYPLQSPGGWQIIGRTPMTFFNPAEADPVWVRAGDQMRFYEIDEVTFATYTK